MPDPASTDDQDPTDREPTEGYEKLSVTDPEDYQRTKKLEMIHEARKQVLRVRQNTYDNLDVYNEFNGEWYEQYHAHLARTVATFGHQVLPIIDEGVEKGMIAEDSLTVDGFDLRVDEFVYLEGRLSGDGPGVPESPEIMAVYRQIERLLRELGIGLELEEEKGPAEI